MDERRGRAPDDRLGSPAPRIGPQITEVSNHLSAKNAPLAASVQWIGQDGMLAQRASMSSNSSRYPFTLRNAAITTCGAAPSGRWWAAWLIFYTMMAEVGRFQWLTVLKTA